jgi:histidinol dehydrogenase
MRLISSTNARAVGSLLDRRPGRDANVQRRVRTIVDRVRRDGDRALIAYARRFDGLDGSIDIPMADVARTARSVNADVRQAIALAAGHIRRIARRQIPRAWTASPVKGVTIEQRVLPLDRVGCYVPAGRFPLPSSLLMTAIPARVAGVREVIAVCPRPDATVLAAALEAGVTRVLRIGGAHAIAALAYGTATVPRVDKIVGPGSAYVAAAKAYVARDCAIDFFAGPTEIAVLSTSGRPAWIAADLLAQAEHDPDARAILITPSRRLADNVMTHLARLDPDASLAGRGGIILTASLDEAIDLCQRFAPEHAVCDNDRVAARLTRAGTVFVGDYSAQASGDYVTGSNHVLPTAGAAAARGGLSAADFVRVATVQRLTRTGLQRIGPAGATLADAEGLRFHAASIRARLDFKNGRSAPSRS